MEKPRVIGHVVSVNGFRIKVELSPEAKSSSRATPDGVQRAVAINSFLTFDLGAGSFAIGILSDLEAREAFDPMRDEELSLELTKPRRIASVQLLGTIRQERNNRWQFDTGITVLPTLDTPSEVANPDVLKGIFGNPPKRNKPDDFYDERYDYPLEIGHLTGDENTRIKASFNDLFSRPLAVVGNTGSGKSYTVASLLRSVLEKDEFENIKTDSHIFILDINGEYANAFLEGDKAKHEREPNKVYLNGEEFCLPAWLMNGEEICNWLQASEATQEPVLKDWWAIAKSSAIGVGDYDPLQVAIGKLDSAIAWLDDSKQPADGSFDVFIEHAKQYAPEIPDWNDFHDVPIWNPNSSDQWRKISNDKAVRDKLGQIRQKLLTAISNRQNEGVSFAKSADSPRFVALHEFRDPNLVDRSTDIENNKRIDQYLLTLKLRMRTRLDDRRWQSFFCYEDQDINSFEKWLKRLGVGQNIQSRVVVFDLSMLASEVLPFACALLGRLLLEAREMLSPNARSQYPWLLVLEEAHNYVRPSRAVEERSQSLSRKAFERVAKEGRKFGLSLIVASQRPSEISPTIISQCANFFSHRLQNPDDIDHFRRIIPRQAQRLLDQVTVLSSGEAIVFGSAVHVPSRVQINLPARNPSSVTAAPFVDWTTQNIFPLNEVLKNWGLKDNDSQNDSLDTNNNDSDEGEIPF